MEPWCLKSFETQPPPLESARFQKGQKPFPIVGIGASAGGLEAVTELLQHLPLDTGMAFVLVEHLDPNHKSVLASILAKATAMPVKEVVNNTGAAQRHFIICDSPQRPDDHRPGNIETRLAEPKITAFAIRLIYFSTSSQPIKAAAPSE